jgi:diaminohydroxyphosphoribosylaminopyrimidine deaminase/5-amino-6-(5-phosphoribosylamino)uracil reductase
VVGARDPNPLVNGKGIKFLRSKGITITENVLNRDCRELNEGYTNYITKGRPLVTLKIAQTLDGRIATSTGHSKWITSDDSRDLAHQLRAHNDAILVGIGTVLADDPMLTVHRLKGVSPLRVILDSKLRIPLDVNVLSDDLAGRTMIITTDLASKEKISRIEEKGAMVTKLDADDRGWVPPQQMLKKLGEIGITSVLVEGGATVHTECLRCACADKMVLFLAPKVLGSGIDAVGDLGIRNINAAIELYDLKIKQMKTDIMLEGYFKQKDEG